ncbi:uncharacterized protein V1518DRAFT_430159, partial [Limtongia smithiae]|uniref:uncharacterized protein n=1 Tax=Limtongia smithiae TaxID=1125753 RepID=UPI0034CD6C0B
MTKPTAAAPADISVSMSGVAYRYIDIGANLTDPMFRGVYNGRSSHEGEYNDLDDVIQRALDNGVKKMLVTGSNLSESSNAVLLAEQRRKWNI